MTARGRRLRPEPIAARQPRVRHEGARTGARVRARQPLVRPQPRPHPRRGPRQTKGRRRVLATRVRPERAQRRRGDVAGACARACRRGAHRAGGSSRAPSKQSPTPERGKALDALARRGGTRARNLSRGRPAPRNAGAVRHDGRGSPLSTRAPRAGSVGSSKGRSPAGSPGYRSMPISVLTHSASRETRRSGVHPRTNAQASPSQRRPRGRSWRAQPSRCPRQRLRRASARA